MVYWGDIMYKSIYRLNIENEKQKEYIIGGVLANGGLIGGGIALNKYFKNNRLKDTDSPLYAIAALKVGTDTILNLR